MRPLGRARRGGPDGAGDRPTGWTAVREGFRFVRGSRLLVSTFVVDLVAMIFGLATWLIAPWGVAGSLADMGFDPLSFYVTAPQTDDPQGSLPFPHDHVVPAAPAIRAPTVTPRRAASPAVTACEGRPCFAVTNMMGCRREQGRRQDVQRAPPLAAFTAIRSDPIPASSLS